MQALDEKSVDPHISYLFIRVNIKSIESSANAGKRNQGLFIIVLFPVSSHGSKLIFTSTRESFCFLFFAFLNDFSSVTQSGSFIVIAPIEQHLQWTSFTNISEARSC